MISSIKGPGKGRNAQVEKTHAQGIDENADDEELGAYYEDPPGNRERSVEVGIHERIGIEMGFPVGHDSHPGPEVHEYHIESRVNHPGKHGVPVHVPLIHEEDIIHQHQDGDKIVKYVIVERKMLVADIVQLVGANGTGPYDEMIHKGQSPQTGRHYVAAVRRIQEGHIHMEQSGPQPHHKRVKVENV